MRVPMMTSVTYRTKLLLCRVVEQRLKINNSFTCTYYILQWARTHIARAVEQERNNCGPENDNITTMMRYYFFIIFFFFNIYIHFIFAFLQNNHFHFQNDCHYARVKRGSENQTARSRRLYYRHAKSSIRLKRIRTSYVVIGNS